MLIFPFHFFLIKQTFNLYLILYINENDQIYKGFFSLIIFVNFFRSNGDELQRLDLLNAHKVSGILFLM